MQAKRLIISVIMSVMLLFSSCPPGGASAAAADKPYQKEIKQAIGFLHQVQNADGGFPNSKGGVSSRTATSWVIMGLSAAGEQVHSQAWAPLGKSPLDYLREQTLPLTESNEHARILMALIAAGQGSEYHGVDLLEKIIGFQQSDGQFVQPALGEADLINAHMWSVLAIASTGNAIPHQEQAKAWLLKQQNSDGGFGWGRGIASDADDTGVAIQALILLGEKADSQAIQKAIAYLESCRQPDAGFSCGDEWMGIESNAASDAWGVLGLLAAGEDLNGQRWQIRGKNPLDHLIGLQDNDGFFNWKEDVLSSPVSMTAYALTALSGRPFPVNIDYSGPSLTTSEANRFSDVKPGYWAYEPITKLVEQGILNGYEDGSFKPDNPVSRAEFSKMMVKGLGVENTGGCVATQFKDVPLEHWALQSIAICVCKGYVKGFEDGSFRPDGDISGAELAAILLRARPGHDETLLKSGPDWYSGYTACAREHGLLYPGFDATAKASRAQCAYSMVQLFRLLQQP